MAWSDLMMTMFIVFLSLFVFQALQNDILHEEPGEVIGGETIETAALSPERSLSFPILDIPQTPTASETSLKKIEPVPVPETVKTSEEIFPEPAEEDEAQPPEKPPRTGPEEIAVALNPPDPLLPPPLKSERNILNESVEQASLEPLPLNTGANISPNTRPTALEETDTTVTPTSDAGNGKPRGDTVDVLYLKGKDILKGNSLNDFASIDLVPDKAVRIVLTGDLLFAKARAKLTPSAIDSLEKIAIAIRDSMDRIHVEGHTDNVPIVGGQYANNWELSLARANAVALFLMEEMMIHPEQIVVSGYSSYKPVAQNDTEENRAKNRRVEIVITKE